MWRCFVFTQVLALGFLVGIPLRSEQMPRITGKSLAGNQVSLPSATAGSVAILCIGFSHGSQSQVKPWRERATKEFQEEARVRVYSIAVLEDAPRFVRGMIVRGMKHGVPAQEHKSFLVLYRGEKELKQIAGFNHSGEAYILLLGPKGEIEWRRHGPPTDAAFKELTVRIDSILRSK